MIEKKIDKIFVLTKRQAVLIADEAKSIPKFKDEILELLNQPIFQMTFMDGFLDAQKFQIVGTLESFFRLFRQVNRQGQLKIACFAVSQEVTIGVGLDLVQENIAAPTQCRRGLQIIQFFWK